MAPQSMMPMVGHVRTWVNPPWKMSLSWSMLYMKTAITYLKAELALIIEHDMVSVECLTPDDFLATPSEG